MLRTTSKYTLISYAIVHFACQGGACTAVLTEEKSESSSSNVSWGFANAISASMISWQGAVSAVAREDRDPIAECPRLGCPDLIHLTRFSYVSGADVTAGATSSGTLGCPSMFEIPLFRFAGLSHISSGATGQFIATAGGSSTVGEFVTLPEGGTVCNGRAVRISLASKISALYSVTAQDGPNPTIFSIDWLTSGGSFLSETFPCGSADFSHCNAPSSITGVYEVVGITFIDSAGVAISAQSFSGTALLSSGTASVGGVYALMTPAVSQMTTSDQCDPGDISQTDTARGNFGGTLGFAVNLQVPVQATQVLVEHCYFLNAGADQTSCATICVADRNDDGAVDINDLLKFLEDFGAADIEADVDGDGGVDVNDLLLFIQLFESGC